MHVKINVHNSNKINDKVLNWHIILHFLKKAT